MAEAGSSCLALLFVLGSSSDEHIDAQRLFVRYLREYVASLLSKELPKEAGSALVQALLARLVIQTSHWEPAWSSYRRGKGVAPPPVEAQVDEPTRRSFWETLAFCRAYTGPGCGASGRAHSVLAQSLSDLAEEAGPDAPLLIVGHSVGALLVEAHISALQFDPAAFPKAPATPLSRGETLLSLFSLGSPLPLWRLSRQRAPAAAAWESRLACVPAPAARKVLCEISTAPLPSTGSPMENPFDGRNHFWTQADLVSWPACLDETEAEASASANRLPAEAASVRVDVAVQLDVAAAEAAAEAAAAELAAAVPMEAASSAPARRQVADPGVGFEGKGESGDDARFEGERETTSTGEIGGGGGGAAEDVKDDGSGNAAEDEGVDGAGFGDGSMGVAFSLVMLGHPVRNFEVRLGALSAKPLDYLKKSSRREVLNPLARQVASMLIALQTSEELKAGSAQQELKKPRRQERGNGRTRATAASST